MWIKQNCLCQTLYGCDLSYTWLTVLLDLFPCSWEIIDSGHDGRSGTGPQLSDSLRVFLQETSTFKQQNPGKVRQAFKGAAQQKNNVVWSQWVFVCILHNALKFFFLYRLVLPAGLQFVHLLCRLRTLHSRDCYIIYCWWEILNSTM